MPNYALVIDLHKCVGCCACDIACKSENNVQEGFFWADHTVRTTGEYPNVRYVHVPTLCNHCENPPCVAVCPTKAMYKDPATGIVKHDAKKCIGCKTCTLADPYKVISFNKKKPHARWSERQATIPGGTFSPAELAQKTNAPVPYYNPERAKTYQGIREQAVVEKCNFCDHRVKDGLLPHCVVACPADARIFGDLNDPASNVSQLLKKYPPKVLKGHLGTKPKVFYIREYNRV